MSAVRVLLASASPRRRQLLELIGIAHDVVPADIDESVRAHELPGAYAERLAREKSQTVSRSFPEALVIGADTTVVLDGAVLGKPRDTADAARMLRLLSGRTHQVITAVAAAVGGHCESAVENVAVTFRALSDGEIDDYVATGEPMDKAGAYGIQGYGATIVERVEGDYFAVMGLPLQKTTRLLGLLGLRYSFAEGVVTNESRTRPSSAELFPARP